MEKVRNFMILTAFAALAACAPSDDRDAGRDSPRSGGDARFASAPIPARLIAESRADIPELTRGAANLSDDILSSRQGLRYVEASSLPFMTSSVEGAAYLRAATVRAMPGLSSKQSRVRSSRSNHTGRGCPPNNVYGRGNASGKRQRVVARKDGGAN